VVIACTWKCALKLAYRWVKGNTHDSRATAAAFFPFSAFSESVLCVNSERELLKQLGASVERNTTPAAPI
jgi:hypothetical protein